MRQSATALVSGLLALALLSGCNAAGEPNPGEPGSALSSDRLGVDWHTLEDATRPTTDQHVKTASVAGTFWVIGENDAVLHATENGVDWRQIDLHDHGLPDNASLLSSSTECPEWAWETNGGLFMVYGVSTSGNHPAGIMSRPWLVEIHGDEIDVRAGVDLGLEDMPGAQDGFDFRTSCVAGIVENDGRRMLIGEGQWWQPYSTGSSDGFVAFEDANGRWTVHADSEAPFLGGANQLSITNIFTLGDRIVVLSRTDRDRYIWNSTNGLDWERIDVEGFTGIRSEIMATSDGERIVLAASSGAGTVNALDVWTTTDGSTWSSQSLLPAENMVTLDLLAHGASGYSLIVGEWDGQALTKHIWLSPDGEAWALEEPGDGFFVPSSATEHAGGLVGFVADTVWVSGLDSWRAGPSAR